MTGELQTILRSAFLTILNTLIILWAFRGIEDVRPISRSRKVLALVFLFVCRLVLSRGLVLNVGDAWFLPTVRMLPFVPFLIAWKAVSISRALYYTFIAWVSLTSCSNILQSPIFFGMIGGSRVITNNDLLDYFINLVITNLLMFIVITVVTKAVSLNNILSINKKRVFVMILIAVCDLYIIYTQTSIQQTGYREFTLYLTIMQVFTLLALVMFERNEANQSRLYQEQLEKISAKYVYQATQSKQDAEQRIHQLHHDMKNHLLVLRNIRTDENAFENYVGDLVSELSHYEGIIHTGNSVLDGLLADKASLAKHHGVECEISMDFSPCSYISDSDLCIIFGNAADNAIEACERMGKGRRMSITSRVMAGNLIVSVKNPYDGKLTRSGTKLLTQKEDKEFHGFGLAGIKRCLDKYSASMSVDTTEPNVFILSLFFPIRA